MSKLTREGFRAMHEQAAEALERSRSSLNVLICAGTGCIASGSMKVYENLREECAQRGLQVYVGLTHHGDAEKSLHIKMSGCHGFCEMGPLVHIEPLGVMYVRVKPEDCREIVERTLLGGEVIERLTYHQDGVSYPRQEDIPFYKKQHRVVLASCGASDAENLEEYIAKGGYIAFEKALFDMDGAAICREISDSGLRGRGAFVLICSNVVISAIKNLIPDMVRIPAFVVVIASFVTLLQMIMQAYVPALYATLGLFIPLIVVNCILLGRAEAFAAKNGPVPSFFDGLGMGLGFTLALTILGGVREFLGTGKLFDIAIMPEQYGMLIFVLAPGAFIALGYLIAIVNKLKKA